ncbi:hypothetical protein COV61_01465, partial [Candidatus Micrarchaeota archaeon CG11_big_fil_rev_8_21_14_0_20_47_5]
ALFFLKNQDNEITTEEFLKSVESSEKFVLVQDLRGAENTEQRRAVINCGIDLAGSLGLLGKEPENIKIAAYEGENCIIENRTTSIAECEPLKWGAIAFNVKYGQEGTKFYPNRAEIEVSPIYGGRCLISAGQAE